VSGRSHLRALSFKPSWQFEGSFVGCSSQLRRRFLGLVVVIQGLFRSRSTQCIPVC